MAGNRIVDAPVAMIRAARCTVALPGKIHGPRNVSVTWSERQWAT